MVFLFENVKFRVIQNFPTHSFKDIVSSSNNMAPVTSKNAKAPKTPQTPRVRLTLEQKMKLIEEASKHWL